MQPTYLSETTPLDHIVGQYGPNWETGLISEHVDLFQRAGGEIRPASSGSGRLWALVPQGKGVKAYPVVCSEVIKVDTEDGPATGRCGVPAVRLGACERHAEDIEGYMAQTEAERAFWERQMDGSF